MHIVFIIIVNIYRVVSTDDLIYQKYRYIVFDINISLSINVEFFYIS